MTDRASSRPVHYRITVSIPVLLVLCCGMARLVANTPVVVLDAGHGGRDRGAQYGRLIEKHANLALCLAVEFYLHEMGIDTAVTRTGDYTLSQEARASYARHFALPIFVSLHYNGSQHSKARGVECFYGNAASKKLATRIQNTLVHQTGAPSRGIKRGNHLKVLHRNKAPEAVLIEAGFLSNPFEGHRISQRSYRFVQARAIAIANHLASLTRVRPRVGNAGRTTRPWGYQQTRYLKWPRGYVWPRRRR